MQRINTPRGAVCVSTPAAKAYDLIGYEAQIGGLDAVATILVELAEKLAPEKLAVVAPTVPLPRTQRLGYLLKRIDEAPRAQALKQYVHARDAVALMSSALLPAACEASYPRDRDWKLIVSAQAEAET